ncbi:MAG: methyltransferase domain-containing protein [Treponema sp.]|nr:methyltransferase domain-containing protein [Treponema sp.]MBR0100717.1 methyltransferase domain-containing protein [Treponema sp.]
MTPLEKYYNKFKEDHRLTTRHGIVEFTVSMKHIHDCIELVRAGRENSSVKLLDVGAGTGRYSVALAREGFDVTAVELVAHNLEILRGKHENVKSWQGDARDLHFLPDETFDVTLLFGPMYHLHSDEERGAALSEAKRVTKKGGFILVAYLMNEYAVLSYCFREGKINEVLAKGTLTADFHTITNINDDLYSYTRLEDMSRLNEKAGLERVKIFAPDGASDYMRRELNALDEESFAHFIEYQMAVSERPDLLGASSHTVDVLRKN